MKLLLAAEIVATYARARRELRRSTLPGTLTVLRAREARHLPRSAPGQDPVATGRQLARATIRTLSVLPADSRCLMRSLVLTRLLARRGIESRLVIAVRPGERFAAHAWVEHDGLPLLPADAPSFEQLVTL